MRGLLMYNSRMIRAVADPMRKTAYNGTPLVALRMQPSLTKKLDEWRAKKMSRSEADLQQLRRGYGL
jgi:hypothetical protein